MANEDAFLPIEIETCIVRLKQAQTSRNIFEFAKQLSIYIETIPYLNVILPNLYALPFIPNVINSVSETL